MIAQARDLFSSTFEKELGVAVRYRTRFHRDVIFAELSINPNFSHEQLADAITRDVPAPALPRPWSPVGERDLISLRMIALIKMKYVQSVGTALPTLPHFPSLIMEGMIAKEFPESSEIDRSPDAIISLELQLNGDGQITALFEVPREGSIPGSLLPDRSTGRIDYIRAMTILGLQRELEAANVRQ